MTALALRRIPRHPYKTAAALKEVPRPLAALWDGPVLGNNPLLEWTVGVEPDLQPTL